MDLYLVRHAIAEPREAHTAGSDADRPLTEDGVKLFRAAASGLRALGIEVDAVLSSPHARAWSTAEILQADAGWPAPVRLRELEPGVPPGASVDALRDRSESALALVGHQPHLSRLGSLLLTGDPDAVEIELKKGGVVYLRSPGAPTPGAALLRWSASPKMLRRLGR